MQSGKWTARSLVEKYLARIEAIDRHGPALRSVLEVNPDARALADALDRERKDKGPRGPLHGIPVLIKDNIDTADRMATTAGSLALVGAKPPRDAFLVTRLRQGLEEAGADLACAASGSHTHPVFGLWPVRLRENQPPRQRRRRCARTPSHLVCSGSQRS